MSAFASEPGSREPSPTVSALTGVDPSRGFDWYRLLPVYWLQNDPTDRHWDAVLNAALDRWPVAQGYCTCMVGPLEVWTANWPYAYGNFQGAEGSGLPMVRTRKRLRRILQQRSGYVRLFASAMSASGQDPQGLEAKPASAAPKEDAR